MRRKRVIVGLAVLAVAVGTFAAHWPRGPRPCRATFERVRDGMAFDEVCAAVGGPPGDYSDGSCVHSGYRMTGEGVGWWLADDGELVVHFRSDGRAAVVAVGPVARHPPRSLWTRLRARLGL